MTPAGRSVHRDTACELTSSQSNMRSWSESFVYTRVGSSCPPPIDLGSSQCDNVIDTTKGGEG